MHIFPFPLHWSGYLMLSIMLATMHLHLILDLTFLHIDPNYLKISSCHRHGDLIIIFGL